MSNWINYSEQRPTASGAYRWRLPSLSCHGLYVTFTAHMRTRGAGYENVISPVFDSWDGYQVSVPAGAQWQELADPVNTEWHKITDVSAEGVDPLPCPYCEKVPRIEAYTVYQGGGVRSSDPHTFNDWKFKCCSWGSTPAYKDPRELVKRRDSVISRLAPAIQS